MAYQLPPLPYPDNALEPHIDAETMQIHHDKHHAAYVNNANAALEGLDQGLQNMSPQDLIQNLDRVPAEKRGALRNNAGGHVNHSLFWQLMGQGKGGQPSGELAQAIDRDFGSFDAFKQKFTQAATTRFGSGWAWLVVKDGKLDVVSTANQDNPTMGESVAGVSGTPILGLDVWEHSYYLKYQNKRPDYIGAFWNVVNWDKVSELYQQAK